MSRSQQPDETLGDILVEALAKKGLAPPASQDRVTDAPHRAAEEASRPSGSVPHGALAQLPRKADNLRCAANAVRDRQDRELFAGKIAVTCDATADWLEAVGPVVGGLYDALTQARAAIASLGEFDLGGVDVPDFYTGEIVGQYGIRDELLGNMDAALASAAGARSAETGTGSGPQDRQSGDAEGSATPSPSPENSHD